MTDRFLIGSYTPSSGGTAEGIALAERLPAADREADSAPAWTVRTLAVLDDPSFLAVTDDRVFAVSETTDGGVHAFGWDGGALTPMWSAASGGDDPCHVRIDTAGVLVVTNYTSGTVAAIPLDGGQPAMELLPDVEGPIPDRQEGPHAHQSIATPVGTVLVSDLGGDALHEFRITADGGAPVLAPIRVHRVDPGVGPRHLAWIDGDLLVTGELDGRLHRLRADADGAYRPVAQDAAFDGEVGEALLSHVEVDAAHRLAYVAVRGRDTIAVFDVADGGVVRIAESSSGGAWPRHFALTPDALIVANQMADAVAVLPLDERGVPGTATEHIEVGSPTCVVAVP